MFSKRGKEATIVASQQRLDLTLER